MIGSVRRSQLITTYGVGSIIAVENESVMVARLDEWAPENEVSEPRLHFGGQKLRLPPAANDPFGRETKDIPVVRFPRWHYCPNAECRRLDSYGRLADGKSTRCKHCGFGLVPSRFIAVCERGHIEDFPYFSWIHAGTGAASDGGHELTLRVTGDSGSLSSVIIGCASCRRERSLEGAFSKEALVGIRNCGGRRPWLGIDEECGKLLRTAQRGASNVWFPVVRSALSIPPWSDGVQQFIQRHWSTLKMDLAGDTIPQIARKLIEDEQVAYSVDEVMAAVRKRKGAGESDRSDREIRAEEFAALSRDREASPGGEFVARITDPPPAIEDYVSSVTIVDRLREVRAFTGFTRLNPPGGDVDPSPISDEVDWVPAIPVRGEGVFLRLNRDRVQDWLGSPQVKARVETLNRRWQGSFFNANGLPVSAPFLLAHVLAHAMISQWALEGGYPAASLRERIYDEEAGTGLLIYTAEADSAGSLGGLIAQAEPGRLEVSIEEAIQRFAWCSSDPVCAETDAQGVDGLNLAACHACALLPETSCERYNALLDRALLVGAPGEPDWGFFGPMLHD